jgi:large subunit ribosomal protein L4
MATIKKYDLSGKEVGVVDIEEGLLAKGANSQMIKDYLIALRANARQWSASTKTRAEVAHSGQKPHPQKGTGRARQGYLGSPQYKGGGRVGGPRPKFDQHVRINQKEKRAAIRHLLAEKIQNEQLLILQDVALKEPKTQKVAQFLKKCALEGRRILFLGDKSAPIFMKSMRNIPKTEFQLMIKASGYDIAKPQRVVVFEAAVEQLMEILKS